MNPTAIKTNVNNDVSVIVVTGGPCAGKTALIDRVVTLLQRHDFAVATLSETPTGLIRSNITPENLTDYDFQELIIREQIRKENIRCRGLLKMNTDKERVLICDRAIFDSLAYIERSAFEEILADLGVSSNTDILSRYDLVVHMVTAANGAEEHYTTENNTARTESPEEARQLDKATKSAWSSHRNHRVIDNSTGFTEKVMRAISAFNRVLHMPNAREKERKHLVTDYGFAEEFVDEHNLSGVELVQAYTKIVDGEEERVRLRRDMETDEVACVRTRKTETKDFGERGETSEDITKSEFRDEVSESVYPAMVKDRYYLYAEGYRFVIDVIKEPVRRAYVEVELVSMEEDPAPPLGLDKHTRQVTGEKKHKAAAIVRRNS